MYPSLSRSLLAGILLLCLSLTGHAFQQRPAFTSRSIRHLSSASTASIFSATSFPLSILSSAPAILDKPETIEEIVIDEDKDTERANKLRGDGWEIRLFNDPFNKREFVARCLSTICGKSDTESYQIMMEAHNNGMGVVGRYQFEIAELYYNSLIENGLMVDMVPVEDE